MIEDVVRRIFVSADFLGNYLWPKAKEGPEVFGSTFITRADYDVHLNTMRDHQMVIWAIGEPDPINPVVEEAKRRIEAVVDTAAKEYKAFGAVVPQWLKEFFAEADNRFKT